LHGCSSEHKIPYPIEKFHVQLTFSPPLPFPYEDPLKMGKGDMLYTVGPDRLSCPCEGIQPGTRIYVK
jgi:hypothetical protein